MNSTSMNRLRRVLSLVIAIGLPIIAIFAANWLRAFVSHMWSPLMSAAIYLAVIAIFRASQWPYARLGQRVMVASSFLVVCLIFVLPDTKVTWVSSISGFAASLTGWLLPEDTHKQWRGRIIVLLVAALISILVVPAWTSYQLKPTSQGWEGLSFPLVDANGDTVSLPTGKVLVFDTWTIACGVCIRQFPEVDALYRQYQSDSMVEVFTINLPGINPTFAGLAHRQTFAQQFDYAFPMYFSDQTSWKGLRITYVPNLFVVDAEGRLVYKGLLNQNWYAWYDHIDRVIARSIR